uniref:Uncharacterized protein 6 n=1 Tax=Halisarca dujardinii TaxID=2583056 RepID=A0AA96S1Q3_HALDU|nr:uncharacterized protein 6 [Halisarca dujardinii]
MVLPASILMLALATLTGCTEAETPDNITVVVDGYDYNSALESPAMVEIGSAFVLECTVAGLPRHSAVLYNWTHPRSAALVARYNNVVPGDANRRTLRVSVIDEGDAGLYQCIATIADRPARVLTGAFQVAVKGGAVLLSNHGAIPKNTAITDSWGIQPKYRFLHVSAFNISTIFCLAPKNSSPYFVRIANNSRENYIEERLGDAAGSGMPQDLLKQWKNQRAALLLIRDTNNVENMKICCMTGTARVCAYLWLQTPTALDTQEHDLNITLETDTILKIEKKLDRKTKKGVSSTYLATLQNSMTGLARTFVTKRSSLNMGSLFPGAAYKVSVREYWNENGTMQYSPTSNHLNISTKALQVNNATKESPPRMVTVSRVLVGGFELHWLPPRRFTPTHYTVHCTANGTNVTRYTVPHQPGSNYGNVTGLPAGECHTEVAAYLGATKVSSHRYTYSYEPKKSAGIKNDPGFNSLSVTLPVIAIFAVLLIVVIAVLIASQIKTFRTKKRQRREKKRKSASPEAPVEEDVYEKFNWSNVTPGLPGSGVMQNQYISTAPHSSTHHM